MVKYIDENYTQEISLAEIAGYSDMSRKYFCRFFKNNFNKTFIEYLNDVRIEHSMGLLNDSNISITDIAISCGFSNMSYFTQTFKKKPAAHHPNIECINNFTFILMTAVNFFNFFQKRG